MGLTYALDKYLLKPNLPATLTSYYNVVKIGGGFALAFGVSNPLIRTIGITMSATGIIDVAMPYIENILNAKLLPGGDQTEGTA